MQSLWYFDAENSDGAEVYLDHRLHGFTVMVNIEPDGVAVHVFPLTVVDEPYVSYHLGCLDNAVFGVPEIWADDGGDRAHIPIHHVGNDSLQLLVNATHEGFIFDLYDDENEFWTAAIMYDDLVEAA